MIVLDTNVLSEVVKPSPSGTVLAWLAAQEPLATFTTTITHAEILYGVERLTPGRRRARLSVLIEKIMNEFQGRILPFDEDAARSYAKIVAARDSAGRPISQFDAMIAAIARSRRAAVATRDVSDFQGCGVRIVNPWVNLPS